MPAREVKNKGVSPRRGRKEMESALRSAIARIKAAGGRLSFVAVASEVGITPSLIHNTYSDIAAEIRVITGKSSKNRNVELFDELRAVRKRLKTTSSELARARDDIGKLTSINESLRQKLADLSKEK